MYIPDLHDFGDRRSDLSSKCIAVGWLSSQHEFSIGPTSPEFREKLRKRCANPVRLMRGFHECDFCPRTSRARGNGEIHVPGRSGEIFVAPALISHYVDVHNYRPAAPFIELVESTEDQQEVPSALRLSRSIVAVADNPNKGNRDAFYSLFLSSRIGARVRGESVPIPRGDYVTTDKDKLEIPMGTGPDGTPLLVLLADIPQLAKREAGSCFFEFDAAVAIKMALKNGAGIAVQASLPGRQAWAGIPKEDVSRLASLHSAANPFKASTHKGTGEKEDAG